MARDKRPDGTGSTGVGQTDGGSDGDLERRRRELGEALAARKPLVQESDGAGRGGGMSGMGYALRLSSEFVAGIVVGAIIGWTIDQIAGTAPWGLIIFLMLGFVAGVLNVLRSAGKVAENTTRLDRDGLNGGK